MKSSYCVGISFYEDQLQLAEVEHTRKKITLTALSERTTSIDFAHASSLSPDHPQLFTFVYELEELVKQNRVHTKAISFALPTDPLFITIVPVDRTLQGSELTSHIHWEFEQFHPDASAKDFIVSAQVIPCKDKNIRRVFIVGLRKGIVGFLKRAIGELRLQVHFIDIDHFSSEKALRLSYPEFSKDVVALFGVRPARVDASLIARGEMVDYRAFPLDSSETINTAVQTFLQYLKQKNGVESPGKIVLHGIGITPKTVSLIQREIGIPTAALDAVRHLKLSKKLHEPFVKESSRFAAAIGLALRTQ